MPAHELYRGNHWHVAKQLPSIAQEVGQDLSMWVASAGYGLLPCDAAIVSYAATFSPGSPDSVTRPGGTSLDNVEWWSALSQWPGPTVAHRSLAELAAAEPDSKILIAVSTAYLSAMTVDIEQAAGKLQSPTDLMLICAGPIPKALEQYALPGDARLQHTLGGSRQSLNARIARRLIETAAEHRFETTKVHHYLKSMIDVAPDLKVYDRERLDQDAVKAYIENAYKHNPAVTKTSLLRRFRDDGLACEQKRFGEIFTNVTKANR